MTIVEGVSWCVRNLYISVNSNREKRSNYFLL